MTEELKCLNCGEGFIPTCHITRQKYCSNECRHRYNNAKRYYKREVNICPECGDVVEQRERGAGRWRRFCSDGCRIKYDQRKIKERRYCSRRCAVSGRFSQQGARRGRRRLSADSLEEWKEQLVQEVRASRFRKRGKRIWLVCGMTSMYTGLDGLMDIVRYQLY